MSCFANAFNFVRASASATLSDATFIDETRVVKIAAAIKTPLSDCRLNFLDTAKMGIDDAKLSAKTTFCNINSIANRIIFINAQLKIISL